MQKNKLKTTLLIAMLSVTSLLPNTGHIIKAEAPNSSNTIDITKDGHQTIFTPNINKLTKVETNIHRHVWHKGQADEYEFFMLADNDLRLENKGKWYVRYKNVGTVGGKPVDLVVKLKDWAAMNLGENWWRSNHVVNNSLGDMRTKSSTEIKNFYNENTPESVKDNDFTPWAWNTNRYADSSLSLYIRKAYDKPLRVINIEHPKYSNNPSSTININASLSIPYVELEQYLVYSDHESTKEDNRVDVSAYDMKLSMNINDIDWGQRIAFNKQNVDIDNANIKKEDNFLRLKDEEGYQIIESNEEGDNNTSRSAAIMTFKPKEGNKNLKLNYIYSNLPATKYTFSELIQSRDNNNRDKINFKEWNAEPAPGIEEYLKKHDGSSWQSDDEIYPMNTPRSILNSYSGNTVGGNNMYFFGTDLTSKLYNVYASRLEKLVSDGDEKGVRKNELKDVDEFYEYSVKGYIPSLTDNSEALTDHIFFDLLDENIEYIKSTFTVLINGGDYTNEGTFELRPNGNRTELIWKANERFLKNPNIRGCNIDYRFKVKIKDSVKKDFNYKTVIRNQARQKFGKFESKSFVTNTTVKRPKQIKVIKVDKENKRIQGVEFSVFNDLNELVAKAVTNENGEVVFDNLKGDNFIVKETKTVHPYRLNNTEFEVDFTKLENKGEYVLKVENSKTTQPLDPSKPSDTGTLGITLLVGVASTLGIVGLGLKKRSNKKDK